MARTDSRTSGWVKVRVVMENCRRVSPQHFKYQPRNALYVNDSRRKQKNYNKGKRAAAALEEGRKYKTKSNNLTEVC